MNQIDGFEKLGLTPRDSRVYISLLKSGMSSIRSISDYTGINRGSVYESIKKLMATGLVSFHQVKINKKYFAEEPSKILDLIEQRKEELNELESTTKKLIPTLVPNIAYMPYANIRFYEDHEGVAVILRDVLDTVEKLDPKEYYSISSKPLRKYLYKRFPHFTKQRVEKNISVKVIAVGSGGEEGIGASRKWLDTDSFTEPSSYNLIYGNKFAMISLNDNLNPYGVVIEDAGVAEMQRLVFDNIWDAI